MANKLTNPLTTIRVAAGVHGIDSVELAARSGIHPVQISRILNGHCRLTDNAKSRLVDAISDAIKEAA
jgi:plasmid maintenance system antidote protein VapI